MAPQKKLKSGAPVISEQPSETPDVERVRGGVSMDYSRLHIGEHTKSLAATTKLLN